MVLAGFGMYAATVNLVPLFTSRGESNTAGAIALALCGAGQLLGRLGYGRFSARFGPGSRTVAVLALGALMTALLAVVSGPAALVMVLGAGAGAVRGVYTLLQATAVSDRWGTARFGTLNGLFSAPLTLAIALAPFGGTGLAALFGGYGTAFAILAALVALGALLATSGRVRRAGAAPG
ncbi:MFS transporter [Sciscionella marina]|uniref:MFS transporter n=1 Tax=Sciscionella marina TaxID=508770 RepID=UPI0003694632|nr:MFS transporter [Sciscionella marina]